MAALLAGLGHAELVSIVKAAQKQQIQGSSGDWKQYIQVRPWPLPAAHSKGWLQCWAGCHAHNWLAM